MWMKVSTLRRSRSVTACAAGHSPTRSFTPDIRISCLLLSQLKQDLLPFNEVRHTLPGYFAKNGRRRVMGIGQLLPHGVHQACILPHREI